MPIQTHPPTPPYEGREANTGAQVGGPSFLTTKEVLRLLITNKSFVVTTLLSTRLRRESSVIRHS